MEINAEIIKNIIKITFSLLKHLNEEKKHSQENIYSKIEEHINRFQNLSEQIQFFGMSYGESIDNKTISLKIDTIPRKFRGENLNTDKVGEDYLLTSKENIILLGDPGSGKTTTLLRLGRRLLLKEPISLDDIWQYPIFIRLRDFADVLSIHEIIANEFGIEYVIRPIKKIRRIIDENGDEKYLPYDEHIPFVGEKQLLDFIAAILNESSALILIDGLDEVIVDERKNLEKSIENLAERLNSSKIIISCRSGDYSKLINFFNALELLPLDSRQIKEISSRWLDNCDDFLDKLNNLPFLDLGNKPLFLCHLIVFYRNCGYLPEKPKDVYGRIIRLMLEGWDRQRRVKRKSKYAHFDPDRKIDFLSKLSYLLTYKIKSKKFSHDNLEKAYLDLCDSFSLPAEEADKVAEEIESHTGLIIAIGPNNYEFSHLSLQEYLCAYYIVRDQFARRLNRYLLEYPSPIAIAVSLSSDPSNWFSAIILKDLKSNIFSSETINSFLSRIVIERPSFTFSQYIGFSFLQLLFLFGDSVKFNLYAMCCFKEISKSLINAMKEYEIHLVGDEYFFRLKQFPLNEDGFIVPQKGQVKHNLFFDLLNKIKVKLTNPKQNGQVFIKVCPRKTQSNKVNAADAKNRAAD